MRVNLRNVDLNLLTVFEAVLREQNLSVAAGALGMTQPAVSNAVARLRQTFDDELFIRSRYGVSPTPRAEELADPVREALDLLRDALAPSADFDPAHSDRVFRLGMGDYGELVLLPALLRLFEACGGGMSIETYPEHRADSLPLLKQARLDLLFGYDVPQGEQFASSPFAHEEVVVIARRDHPIVRRRLTRKMYLEARHVVLNQQEPNRTVLEDLWREQGEIPRRIMATVRQYASMPTVVAQTDCLATLPRRMAIQAAASLPLTILPLPFELGPVPVSMIWHRALERDPAHQWLRGQIDRMVRAGA